MTKTKKIAELTLTLRAAEAAFDQADCLMDAWTPESGRPAEEVEAAYDQARANLTNSRDALRAAQFAGRRICPHTAAMVSANID